MVKNDESTNLYVARQAILNKDKKTVAYELLFRDSFENRMPVSVNKYVATKKLLVNSMAVFGLDKLTGNKPAFINFTDKNIENGQVELLPPDKVYIEILEDVKISRTLLSTCKRLNLFPIFKRDLLKHKWGLYWPLIELASIIKIDFSITKTADARKSVRKTIPRNISLLAEKVETRKDYEQAANLGYDFFQGYFFYKPTIISKRTTVTNALSQFLLLQEINHSTLNINELENIIGQDISLVHKLLKYINSPFIGLSYKISSIKQAIILLGKDKIQKWINIICLQELSQKHPNELFAILLVRGKLCELIAANMKIISGIFL
ncbi:EAL and HDOD domain-containing protein [Pectinatus frisingensis]|uniref:EAL and HDOD domain-containing protein n=1 Tax=Pectinatus frisingensis TaxID=865 RepID=UPI0018C6B12F|nr:HDOD domain-containing protein [Pectinatus frisingensis]